MWTQLLEHCGGEVPEKHEKVLNRGTNPLQNSEEKHLIWFPALPLYHPASPPGAKVGTHSPLHTRQGGGDSNGEGTMGTSDTLRLLVLFVLGMLTYLIPFNSHKGV